MVPSAFVGLVSLPLSPNGKVDRRALPAPESRAQNDQVVPPRNDLERTIAAIWREVLHLDEVGVHDNFFDLGGHSLMAVAMLLEVKKLTDKNLPLATLLQAQTIAALADLNTLRAARISPYAAQPGTNLLTEISLERRRELFLEGHRWFDLRMAGQGITRGGDCKAPATACSLASNSFRFVWPIPQDEMKANPNIATQQNTGY